MLRLRRVSPHARDLLISGLYSPARGFRLLAVQTRFQLINIEHTISSRPAAKCSDVRLQIQARERERVFAGRAFAGVQLAAQRWRCKKSRFSLVIFGPAFTKKKSGQSGIYSTKRFNDVFTPLRFGKINCGADVRDSCPFLSIFRYSVKYFPLPSRES